MIYLDNAATTQIDPIVLEAMLPYLREEYGNAGALYSIGRRAKDAVENARSQVARFINCKPEQIIFTSSGSEGNNLVMMGVAEYLKKNNKKGIAVSEIEHDSVIKSAEASCIKHEFDCLFLPVTRDGFVEIDTIKNVVRDDRFGMASVMYVNNETGVINPVSEIADECHKNGVLFHTDCVQAAGGERIDVEKIGCDFLTISSHKIHGPKGVGAIYVRDINTISPIIYGGSEQEFGLRGGTENVAGIVGFGKACEAASRYIDDDLDGMMIKSSRFYEKLLYELSQYGQPGIHINGGKYVSGKTTNIRIDGVDAQTLLLMLDASGICISTGSACRSREIVPSRVLMAMGLTEEEARSSVRVSVSRMTTVNDIDVAARTMAKCILKLRVFNGTV